MGEWRTAPSILTSALDGLCVLESVPVETHLEIGVTYFAEASYLNLHIKRKGEEYTHMVEDEISSGGQLNNRSPYLPLQAFVFRMFLPVITSKEPGID
jgi:hypothetical protein